MNCLSYQCDFFSFSFLQWCDIDSGVPSFLSQLSYLFRFSAIYGHYKMGFGGQCPWQPKQRLRKTKKSYCKYINIQQYKEVLIQLVSLTGHRST